LNLRTLLKERVPLPPIEAQLALADLLESLAPIRARAELGIGFLREYRSRLIADTVTGKLDVREAATRLPDQVEEPEPLDEVAREDFGEESGASDADELPEETGA
jgi:type I restriction enzyme S subunit